MTRELTVYQANGWLYASDEPPGTKVPTDTERWIATRTPVEVRQ